MEDMITKRNQLRAQQLIQALKQRNMDASSAEYIRLADTRPGYS